MTEPGASPSSGVPLVSLCRGSAEDLVDATSGHTPRWWLRGSRMRSRRGLMDEWAAAAQFPPHFGGTWDAFRDALADLPEGGTFLVLEAEQLLQDAPPQDGHTLLAVLQNVREDLAPRFFQVILQVESDPNDTLIKGLRAMGQDGGWQPLPGRP